MTPKEFQKAALKLEKRMGSKISIHAHISMSSVNQPALYGSVYHAWPKTDSIFAVGADDFPALLAAIEAKWTEYEAEYNRQVTRKMALAIIRITAQQGHCTDAALRQEFDDETVKRFSADACADADDIAGRGPFTITVMGGANGAPDQDTPHLDAPSRVQ